MSNIVIIGFTTEGPTDIRFLDSVIRRTFEDVALECESLIDIHSIEKIAPVPGTFTNMVIEAAKKSENLGVMVLCVHTDSDSHDDTATFKHKITPAFESVIPIPDAICKNLVAVVPVTMTEAWMLADKELIKNEIGTTKTILELGLDRLPEQIADPKSAIKEALRIALQDNTRRRRRDINISDLYQPLGQKISIVALETLPSYVKFKESVRAAYRMLNYLH